MKLQKISDIRPTLWFTEYDFIQKYRDSFKNSELGRIYDQLPLMEIGAWFMERLLKKNPQGNKPMFPIEDEIALRGKENKRVEFGAKVNNIQIDGISFIERHSFEASTWRTLQHWLNANREPKKKPRRRNKNEKGHNSITKYF